MAFSLAVQASRHKGRTEGLSNFSHLLINEKASLICLPKMTPVGDILQSGSGVFLSCRRARRSPSVSTEPDGPTLSMSVRFAFFTATSARPLDRGKWADETLWCTPHRERNESSML
jgi:hypothetical protein